MKTAPLEDRLDHEVAGPSCGGVGLRGTVELDGPPFVHRHRLDGGDLVDDCVRLVGPSRDPRIRRGGVRP